MAETTPTDDLRATLTQLLEGEDKEAAVEFVLALFQGLQSEIDALAIRLKASMRGKSGGGSERLAREQLDLFLLQLAQSDAEAAALASEPDEDDDDGPDDDPSAPTGRGRRKPKDKRKKRKRGRKKLPDHLPTERITLALSDTDRQCTTCGCHKKTIGHECSEVLDYVPGHFKKIVFEREKAVCVTPQCLSPISTAPSANKPIEKGIPYFGLLADVVVRKYAEHMPINRLRNVYRRQGVDLALSTLYDWDRQAAELLEPIAKAIHRNVLDAHVVQVDDTSMTVLDAHAPGGSKSGHQWAFLGDQTWVSFAYTETWKHEEPKEMLQGHSGWLQGDAYAGFQCMTGPVEPMDKVGCWAHARRYFITALDGGDVRAAVPLKLIQDLYRVERAATNEDVRPDERRVRRLIQSKPILDRLIRWIRHQYPRTLPKSPLRKGLTYLINQWDTLKRFLEDGRLKLDNNDCERQLRHICTGRKNWLFSGSDAGAKRAATHFTIVGTCLLNDVEPWAYLHDVMYKLVDGWPHRRLEELLPPMWKLEHGRNQALAA